MREIQLTQGQVALVDDEDFDWLSRMKWTAARNEYGYYAVKPSTFYGESSNKNKKKGKQITILMHEMIMLTPTGMVTDHIDHNTLNNQKSNLRVCTQCENTRNQKKQNGCSSRFKGVCVTNYNWKTKKKSNTVRYISNIGSGSNHAYLGVYEYEVDAAMAYDNAAREMYGEFAYLNFPGKGENGIQYDFLYQNSTGFYPFEETPLSALYTSCSQ